MHLETAATGVKQNATRSDIEHFFNDDQSRGEFIILTAADGSFLQAAGDGDGPFVLEYRVESTGEQHQATQPVAKQAAKQTFMEYLDGNIAWRERHGWKPLEEASGGCLGVLFLAASLPTLGAALKLLS